MKSHIVFLFLLVLLVLVSVPERILLNIGIVSNETNTDVRMYNLTLLYDLHYSMYK